MPQPTNKISQFWQELKRRKVFRVVAMYAGSAYIIIELVNNVSEPLHLPEWTATVIILLLIIGFPIVAILSWIFDITPEGVQKTESIEVAKEQEEPSPLVRRKLRVSDIIIALLVVVVGILVYPKIFMKDKFRSIREADGRISIAVMPFENLTGDSTMNWLQRGISSLIINGLGNSAELMVFDDHIMFEALESMDHIFTAGISLNKGKEVAERVKSETYISGSYQGRMGKYWILLNLIDTESGAITWTKKVEGDLRSPEYLDLADSLCNDVKNHLEIQVLKKEAAYDFKEAYPSSAEAYQYFIKGTNMILTRDYLPAVEYFKKALKIDSTFTFASFYIAYAYCFTTPAQMGQAKIWTQKAYKTRENLPLRFQNWLSLWHACFISKSLPDISLYCNLLEKSAIESRLLWFDLGVTYFSFLKQYEKAVETFERIENICLERNSNWKYEDYYLWYGKALHYVGNHVKEKEIFELGLSLCSDQAYQREIFLNQTICGISEADTTITKKYLDNYIVQLKEIGQAADELEASIGLVYYEANKMVQAEEHLRKALSMNPKYPYYPFLLGRTLINGNINVNEGLELIQKVFEIHPNWWPVYQWKGIGLYKMGEYEASLEYLKKSEELVNTFKYDIYQYIKMAEQAIDNESQ